MTIRLPLAFFVQLFSLFFLVNLAFGEWECPKGSVKQITVKGKAVKTQQKVREIVTAFPEDFRWDEKMVESDGMIAMIVDRKANKVYLLGFKNPKGTDSKFPIGDYTLQCITLR